jgi:hypothetical protein
VRVPCGRRIEVAGDAVAVEVDDPVVRDAEAGVERRLGLAVVALRAVGNLDDKQCSLFGGGEVA